MVDIWIIDTLPRRRPPLENALVRRVLSHGDQRRARRLAAGPERESFVAARIALRLLLSPYCPELGRGAPLAQGATGKPFLADGPAFNLSATTGLALVAISPAGDVGVDIEQVRDVPFAAEAFARVPALERSAPVAGPDDGGATLIFLRAWTRFEASLKSAGLTLGSALAAVQPAVAAGIARAHEARTTVTDLPVRHGYVAACAHGAGDAAVTMDFDWDALGPEQKKPAREP